MSVPLPIPVQALEDCGAILGRRGAGKSGTGRALFEHELRAGHRCCAIDPKGDWWGIRMDKGGAPSGFDLPIFGGTHGDLALSEDMGETLGRLIATHDLSCVVDLSAFPSQAAQRRFTRDFAETLFTHNRQPLTLFVDEADQLAPQRVPADMAQLLHAMETLIRLGRQRGIFMWMLTQRPQTLNKNLLSQAETLIAMKVTTPHDRGAIRDWMEAHDPDQAKAIEQQLAKLGVGEAFVWVPAADFLERVQFPLFETYDSGRTPRHGETVAAVQLPTIDLSGLEAALSEAGEHSGYPDDTIPAKPIAALKKGDELGRMLKKRDEHIAELEKELRAEREERRVDTMIRRHLRDHWISAFERVRTIVDEQLSLAAADERDFQSRAKPDDDAPPMNRAAAEPGSRPAAGRSAAATAEKMAATGGETPPAPSPASPDGAAAGETEFKALAGLAAVYPSGLTEAAWAARTGYARKGGAWVRRRKRYVDAGLVEERSGLWFATVAGIERAGEDVPDFPPPGPGLVDWWAARLGAPGRLLKVLSAVHPRALTRDALAAEVGMTAGGGALNRHVSALKRAELVRETKRRLSISTDIMG